MDPISLQSAQPICSRRLAMKGRDSQRNIFPLAAVAEFCGAHAIVLGCNILVECLDF